MTFNQKPLKLRVGTVGTPYHMIQLKVGTTLDAMNEDEPSSQVQHRLDNMKWALDDEEEEEKENQNDKENPENETVENEGEEDSVQNETANANDSDQSNNNNGIHTPNDEMDESQQRDQNEKRQNSKKATTSRNEPSEQQIEGFVLSVSEFTYSSIKQQFPSLKSSTLKGKHKQEKKIKILNSLLFFSYFTKNDFGRPNHKKGKPIKRSKHNHLCPDSASIQRIFQLVHNKGNGYNHRYKTSTFNWSCSRKICCGNVGISRSYSKESKRRMDNSKF